MRVDSAIPRSASVGGNDHPHTSLRSPKKTACSIFDFSLVVADTCCDLTKGTRQSFLQRPAGTDIGTARAEVSVNSIDNRPPVADMAVIDGGDGRLFAAVLRPTPMKAFRVSAFKVMTSSYVASESVISISQQTDGVLT